MGSRRTANKKPVLEAEKKFEAKMRKYEQYEFQPLDLDKYKQENLLEDMPGMEAYTEAADYATEKFQQSQANIMGAYRGVAGASGIAGLAQQLSMQQKDFGREQQIGLGQRAAEARRLGLQESMRLRGQERQMELTQDVGRRDFGYGKMTTLLGVQGEQLAGARNLYASQLQADAQREAGFMNAVGTAVGVKAGLACIPKGVHIDTVDGSIAIENIKSGDMIVGYSGNPVKVLQKHEYLEDPTAKRFYKVKFDNGSTVDVCDMHRIKGERAMDITENVISKDIYNGVEFSYDLLTEDAGYRIDGVPVNSMIEEMAELIVKIKNK